MFDSDRSKYAQLIKEPQSWNGSYKRSIEKSVDESGFVDWVFRQLLGKTKADEIVDVVHEVDPTEQPFGILRKTVKCMFPNILHWRRDTTVKDTVKGTTFTPVEGHPTTIKIDMILGDYACCIDVWKKKNPDKKFCIKFVYADVPQGMHNDEDKPGQKRPEDAFPEDPKKVGCPIFFKYLSILFSHKKNNACSSVNS